MAEPATVVKRRPAPRIIRNPIPAAVGIDPASMIAIRLPAGVVDRHAWTPAPAVTIHVHPTAIRRKRVIKIIHRDLRRLLHWLRRRCGFRRFGGGGCRSGLSRWLIRRHDRLLLQLLVALYHRGDDFVRQANVLQINDFVRVEIEHAAGIADVCQNHTLLHTGLHEPDDLSERAGGRNARWQCAGHR